MMTSGGVTSLVFQSVGIVTVLISIALSLYALFGGGGAGSGYSGHHHAVSVVSLEELHPVRIHVQVDAVPGLAGIGTGVDSGAADIEQQAGGVVQHHTAVGKVERGFHGVKPARHFVVRYGQVGGSGTRGADLLCVRKKRYHGSYVAQLHVVQRDIRKTVIHFDVDTHGGAQQAHAHGSIAGMLHASTAHGQSSVGKSIGSGADGKKDLKLLPCLAVGFSSESSR